MNALLQLHLGNTSVSEIDLLHTKTTSSKKKTNQEEALQTQ
jgi:hypothetical protein